MKLRAFLILAVICLFVIALSLRSGEQTTRAAGVISVPASMRAVAFAVSRKASFLATSQEKPAAGGAGKINVREVPSGAAAGTPAENGDRDGRVAAVSAMPVPTPSLSFNGLSNFDNIAAYSLFILPPDMTGDVGPDHYVQAVNALVRVFDKNGNPSTPPFKMSQLFAPLGTVCATRNDGLPIVLYDPLADRWMLSQYCYNVPPFRQMIAVSKTGDPAGEYYLYEFVMPNVRIHDFPKFGIWPDGYYMSTEEFLGSDYAGAGMFAFDRSKILAGDASASYVYFHRPSASINRRSNMLPSDLDGIRPPAAGTPNPFVSYIATEYGDAQDAIRLFDFHADFASPANSTFTERPESPIAVAAFDPTSPEGRADISQPAPGERLDSNSDRVNYRVAYRNLGSQESLVFNQTVSLSQSPYRAGVRLYEIRRTGNSPFTVVEQSTIGEPDSSRWIGSSAQDHQGNLAVTYNFVSDEKKPSINYTGRLATEPAGTFRTERALIAGTGVQKAFGWRWGDYSGMSVDPVDDCTFWMTGEYYTQESQDFSDFTWLTRIGRFKFEECTAASRAIITGTVTNASNGQPIVGAGVSASVYTRRTAADGNYGNLAVLPGNYGVTVSAAGFRSQTVSVAIADGQTVTQNFALQPIAVLENTGTTVAGESCGANRAPDPGETVTIAVTLRNTGAANTQNLVATLVAGGGVTNPGPAQNYGALVVNGTAVSRPFTFTVSPSVPCGAPITMTLQFQDGAENLGSVAIDLQTGTPKIAFQQSFDRNQQAQLPPRWTRDAFAIVDSIRIRDYNRNWTISAKRSQSGTKSAFSPDLNQVGLNEMVSPVFRVGTNAAEVIFQNWYELETTFLRNRLYDGSVLEIRIGGGQWQDILAAGGLFLSGGYDGTIDGCCQNPLAGRLGWSGRSGINPVSEFITTRAKLPVSAAGQTVQLRWRIGTDIGSSREGQYIDDVTVTDGFLCGCSAAN